MKLLDVKEQVFDDFTAVAALDCTGAHFLAGDPWRDDRLGTDCADACEHVSGIEGVVADDGVDFMEAVEDIVSFRNGIALSTGDVELA